MKKTNLILIFLMLILIGGVMAETTMNFLTKGFADRLYCPYGGCNYTGNVYAQDWLLWNGSSCCQGGAAGVSSVTATSPIVSSGGTTPDISWNPINIALGWYNLTNIPKLGNTTAEIRSQFSSSSNITYDESTGTFFYNGTIGAGGASPFTDIDNIYIFNDSGTITFNETKSNKTTNASIDLRVNVDFLRNLLDIVYLTRTIVQGWINSNSTADRAYTDTRVDSIDNHTKTIDSNASTACNTGNILFGADDGCMHFNDTGDIRWVNIAGDTMAKGADLRIQDSEGEYHNISRVLQISDEMNRNITLSGLNGTLAPDGNLTITTLAGSNIIVNIDKNESILDRNSDSIIITSGTNESPIFNQIIYTNVDNPVLTKRTTLGLKSPSVAAFLQGANFTYVSAIGLATINNFIGGLFNRLLRDGSTYRSGFEINVSTNMVNISTGVINLLLDEIRITSNHSTSDLYVHLHADNTFHQHLALDTCASYNDGSVISNNKYYNAVLGIAITHDGVGVMYIITQDKPSTEYTKAIDAEVDIEDTINYFPPDDIVSLAYIPIVRVVIRRSGGVNTIQTLSNTLLFDDLRGTVTKTSSSPPPSGITSHPDLTNLDYASAGHTGFVSSTELTQVNTSENIYDLAPHTNRTDADIANAVQNNTILRNGTDVIFGIITGITFNEMNIITGPNAIRLGKGTTQLNVIASTGLNQDLLTTSSPTFDNVTASNKVTTDTIQSSDGKKNISYSNKSEGHLELDGDGDYVNVEGIEDNVSLATGTVTAWIKQNSLGDGDWEHAFVLELSSPANDDQFFLGIRSTDTIGVRYRENSENYQIYVAETGTDSWTFIAATWNITGDLKFYKGDPGGGAAGTLDMSATVGDGIWNESGIIGARIPGPYQQWDGQISDVMVLNDSLNQGELEAIYDLDRNPTSAQVTGLSNYGEVISWWPLSDNLEDSVGTSPGTAVDNAFISQTMVDDYNLDKIGIRELVVQEIGNFLGTVNIQELLTCANNANFNKNITVADTVRAGSVQAGDGYSGSCTDGVYAFGDMISCDD